MEPLPTFELFVDPVKEEVFKRSEESCEACRRARGWMYVVSISGDEGHPERLCPWCIADGTAGSRGCFFNNGTHLSRPSGASLPAEELELVEQRTPGFVTWKDYGWVMCCGRACVYLGEADAADLAEGGKWAAAVPSIVEDTYELGWSDEGRAEMLAHVKRGAGPCAYVFQCRNCGGLLGFWDIH